MLHISQPSLSLSCISCTITWSLGHHTVLMFKISGFSNCFSSRIILHFFRKCDIIQDLWHNTTDFIRDKYLSAWSDTDEIISHHLAWSLLTWAQQYHSQGQLQCFHLDPLTFAVLLGCSPTLFILCLPIWCREHANRLYLSALSPDNV